MRILRKNHIQLIIIQTLYLPLDVVEWSSASSISAIISGTHLIGLIVDGGEAKIRENEDFGVDIAEFPMKSRTL